jgi:hypothetical protein
VALTALPTDAQTFAIARDVAAFWIWTDIGVPEEVELKLGSPL